MACCIMLKQVLCIQRFKIVLLSSPSEQVEHHLRWKTVIYIYITYKIASNMFSINSEVMNVCQKSNQEIFTVKTVKNGSTSVPKLATDFVLDPTSARPLLWPLILLNQAELAGIKYRSSDCESYVSHQQPRSAYPLVVNTFTQIGLNE